jgi:hypothetical protein
MLSFRLNPVIQILGRNVFFKNKRVNIFVVDKVDRLVKSWLFKMPDLRSSEK